MHSNVPKEEAERLGAKVIATKWAVDTYKGAGSEPNYMSRLAGRERNLSDRPDLFAATPPLDSPKCIVSKCASSQRRARPHKIPSIDVSRAYFCANSIRPVLIRIPAEDRQPGNEDMVGKLNVSLYGTRNAAQNWAV